MVNQFIDGFISPADPLSAGEKLHTALVGIDVRKKVGTPYASDLISQQSIPQRSPVAVPFV
jgi:hypothetical protein